MKGKGIGRFFADIKEKLRAVSTRDRLNFKPETKIADYTLKDLDEFQERLKKTEKELESAKNELDVLKRITVPADATEEVKSARERRIKELEEKIPKLEEDLERFKRSELLAETRKAFEAERKDFVAEYAETIAPIPHLIEEILEAIKTNNAKAIRNANRRLEEQLKAVKRLSFDAAERSALYTRAFGEETTIVLPSYRLTEERVRELYVTASTAQDKAYKDDNVSRQIDGFIILLESLAPEGLDFDKMRVEEDRKMDKKDNIEELKKDIEDLRKDMEHMRSIPVDSPDLLKEYEAMKAKVDAFLEKYKTSDLIEVQISEVAPNIVATKYTNVGVPTMFDKFITDEQLAKIKTLTKEEPPKREPKRMIRPLKGLPVEVDGVFVPLRLEDIDPKEFADYIEELNKDIDSIKSKISVINAIPADSPLFVPSFERLVTDIQIFKVKHSTCYGAKIEYNADEFKLTVKGELEGVKSLEQVVLTPEQIEAYKKAKALAEPPKEEPEKKEPKPEELSFGDRVKIREINDDTKAISQKIRVIRTIPEDSPLLAEYSEKLIRDLAAFAAKYKDSPFVDISFDMNKLIIKGKKEGITELEAEVLTPAQVMALGKSGALEPPKEEPPKKGPEGGEKPPITEPPKGGPGEDKPPITEPPKEEPPKKGPEGGEKPPVTDPRAEEKKAFRDKYIVFVNVLNSKINTINENNELLSRMVTYNPDEMELEIATETTTYELEKGILKDKLELANMRLEYFKKYGGFLLSDPEVLATKLEDVKFESSKDLDAFVNARNVKIIEAENDIIDLANQIEELKAAKETGYETKVNELEERIKLLQRFVRAENSIIQRRLAAEGKSIDIAAYYEKRNAKMAELRARLGKGGKPGPERGPEGGTPGGGPGEGGPGEPAPTEDEKANKRKMLNTIYAQLVDKRIAAIYEGNTEVSLSFDKVEYADYEKFKEVYEEVRTKWNAIFAERVKEEQVDVILEINKKLDGFYKKTVKEKRIPTKEEVQEFIDSIDKKGLKCEITYDLSVNRFVFKYTHKERDRYSIEEVYNEVERVNDRMRIYDKKLHANREREVGVGDVKYVRRDLSFSPDVKAQKVDREAAALIKNVSGIEIVRVKNKLKIMYTDTLKKKLESLKANIKILNTKSKGSKVSYDVELGNKKNEEGKYESEVTLKGNPNTDNYSMVIGYNVDGVDSEVQLDLEEMTRSR